MSKDMFPFRVSRPESRFKAAPGGLNRKLWAPDRSPKRTDPEAPDPTDKEPKR